MLRMKLSVSKTFRLNLMVAFILLCFLIYAPPGLAAEVLKVYVVNYPLKYFAERVGGAHVSVQFPAPVDLDPAYWNPDLATIAAYQKADLILFNGAGYAKWVNKVSLPRSKTIDTSKKFKGRYIHTKALTHSHGSEGKHAHEDLAFTTWLDLDLAVMQAEAVLNALTRKRPGQKVMFQQNYEKLKDDLIALDKAIEKIVSKDQTKPLIVSHPVYDYFTRYYRLNIKSVHWEPEEIPSRNQWVELQRMLKKHPAKWMIWEGIPDPATVEKLKSMGIGSVVFNPCSNVPKQGDFLSVMKHNVINLKVVFR